MTCGTAGRSSSIARALRLCSGSTKHSTCRTSRTLAQNALGAAARDSPPQRASQALTLLGIIAAEGGSTQADAALSNFTDAVRTYPGNEHAKYNLELLLRLTAANDVRAGAGQGSGSGKSGQSGAAVRPPGRGY